MLLNKPSAHETIPACQSPHSGKGGAGGEEEQGEGGGGDGENLVQLILGCTLYWKWLSESTGGLAKPELLGPMPSLGFSRSRQHPGFYFSDQFPAKAEATGQGHAWRALI